MENVRYVLHDDELLKLTEHYGITSDEIYDIGGIDGKLAKAANRALADRGRGAILDYWRVFLAKYSAGDIDYDVNGLFRPEFDITYED